MIYMHRRDKDSEEQLCDVSGCSNTALRSLSGKKVGDVLALKKDKMKRAHLCKDHYKEYKKKTKKDRELEALGR